MTLLLPADALTRRIAALADPAAIGGLAPSLLRELHAAVDVPVPDGKARLTRYGGRCTSCGTLLAFDPRSACRHVCTVCGITYDAAEHHQWWTMNAHLWTAEQAARAAALAAIAGDPIAARRADDILDTYAARYLRWPNRDNALGPTRPFFSTYLESIWLLHLVVALDLRAFAGASPTLCDRVRDQLVAPSAALIESFHEGRSNRQVWHAAALLAAGGVLNDGRMQQRAGGSLIALLQDGLHPDGSWYEGENYHLFAHRGLLTGVTLAETAGIDIPGALIDRFDSGFAAPFRTMLPDGTFPARRDSQYGVSLRQWRTSDWVECGIARRDDPALRAALADLYADWPAAGETGRWRSTADAERNEPSVRLTRADCGWRALLLAPLALPKLDAAVPTTQHLEGQGYAAFRRDGGRFYVGFDYGDPGDGHGHPDRLNLLIATRESRWLDDVGTGSYTAPSLAWYRGTLSHNAPLIDGRSQEPGSGTLVAFDEVSAELGWVSARFTNPATGTVLTRTVVVAADHVLDELVWESPTAVRVDLPMQAELCSEATSEVPPFAAATDMDRWLVAPSPAGSASRWRELVLTGVTTPARPKESAAPEQFSAWVFADPAGEFWTAGTIGPPGGRAHALTALRQTGAGGRSVRVIAARGVVSEVSGDTGATIVRRANGSVVEYRRCETGWNVRVTEGKSLTESILGGCVSSEVFTSRPAGHAPSDRAVPRHVSAGAVWFVTLAGDHYRTTEESWLEAGQPTATFNLEPRGDTVRVTIRARLDRPPHFAAACDENPLDNEPADINSDGVQLHWEWVEAPGRTSVLAVPDGSVVRTTMTEGAAADWSVSWHPTDDGFEIEFVLARPPRCSTLELDCCVNEMPAGRERRRGQLVLSGQPGDRAYLRGPRQPADRALHFVFSPVPS